MTSSYVPSELQAYGDLLNPPSKSSTPTGELVGYFNSFPIYSTKPIDPVYAGGDQDGNVFYADKNTGAGVHSDEDGSYHFSGDNLNGSDPSKLFASTTLGKTNWNYGDVYRGNQTTDTNNGETVSALWGGTSYPMGRVTNWAHIDPTQQEAQFTAGQTRDALWNVYDNLLAKGATPALNPDQIALKLASDNGTGLGRNYNNILGYGAGANSLAIAQTISTVFMNQPQVVAVTQQPYTVSPDSVNKIGDFGTAHNSPQVLNTLSTFVRQGVNSDWGFTAVGIGMAIMGGMAASEAITSGLGGATVGTSTVAATTAGVANTSIAAVGAGAVSGAINAGVQGGDILKGALTGAFTSALGLNISPVAKSLVEASNGTINLQVAQAAVQAAAVAAKAGFTGGDVTKAIINSLEGSAISAGMKEMNVPSSIAKIVSPIVLTGLNNGDIDAAIKNSLISYGMGELKSGVSDIVDKAKEAVKTDVGQPIADAGLPTLTPVATPITDTTSGLPTNAPIAELTPEQLNRLHNTLAGGDATSGGATTDAGPITMSGLDSVYGPASTGGNDGTMIDTGARMDSSSPTGWLSISTGQPVNEDGSPYEGDITGSDGTSYTSTDIGKSNGTATNGDVNPSGVVSEPVAPITVSPALVLPAPVVSTPEPPPETIFDYVDANGDVIGKDGTNLGSYSSSRLIQATDSASGNKVYLDTAGNIIPSQAEKDFKTKIVTSTVEDTPAPVVTSTDSGISTLPVETPVSDVPVSPAPVPSEPVAPAPVISEPVLPEPVSHAPVVPALVVSTPEPPPETIIAYVDANGNAFSKDGTNLGSYSALGLLQREDSSGKTFYFDTSGNVIPTQGGEAPPELTTKTEPIPEVKVETTPVVKEETAPDVKKETVEELPKAVSPAPIANSGSPTGFVDANNTVVMRDGSQYKDGTVVLGQEQSGDYPLSITHNEDGSVTTKESDGSTNTINTDGTITTTSKDGIVSDPLNPPKNVNVLSDGKGGFTDNAGNPVTSDGTPLTLDSNGNLLLPDGTIYSYAPSDTSTSTDGKETTKSTDTSGISGLGTLATGLLGTGTTGTTTKTTGTTAKTTGTSPAVPIGMTAAGLLALATAARQGTSSAPAITQMADVKPNANFSWNQQEVVAPIDGKAMGQTYVSPTFSTGGNVPNLGIPSISHTHHIAQQLKDEGHPVDHLTIAKIEHLNSIGAPPEHIKGFLKHMHKLAGGGSLGGYSDGGHFLKGPGDGMSDDIPARIGEKQEARLANEEFVIPADVVSHLGNGSSESGAKVLYHMMDKVRKARTGTTKQGKQINPLKFLPK